MGVHTYHLSRRKAVLAIAVATALSACDADRLIAPKETPATDTHVGAVARTRDAIASIDRSLAFYGAVQRSPASRAAAAVGLTGRNNATVEDLIMTLHAQRRELVALAEGRKSFPPNLRRVGSHAAPVTVVPSLDYSSDDGEYDIQGRVTGTTTITRTFTYTGDPYRYYVLRATTYCKSELGSDTLADGVVRFTVSYEGVKTHESTFLLNPVGTGYGTGEDNHTVTGYTQYGSLSGDHHCHTGLYGKLRSSSSAAGTL